MGGESGEGERGKEREENHMNPRDEKVKAIFDLLTLKTREGKIKWVVNSLLIDRTLSTVSVPGLRSIGIVEEGMVSMINNDHQVDLVEIGPTPPELFLEAYRTTDEYARNLEELGKVLDRLEGM